MVVLLPRQGVEGKKGVVSYMVQVTVIWYSFEKSHTEANHARILSQSDVSY